MSAGWRRHFRIARHAAGSLRRRWRRNLAVAGVYAAVIFPLASVVILGHALTTDSVSSLAGAPEITVQRLSMGRHAMSPSGDSEAISRITGVQAAFPRLWGYHADPATGETLLLRVPEDGSLRGRSAAVGSDLLRRRAVGVGGTLRFRDPGGSTVDLTVAAVAETASALESAALVNVSETAFRELTGIPPGEATDLAVRVRNRRELPTIAGKIADLFPSSRPIVRDELLRTYASVFHWRSGAVVALLLLPVAAFILFAWDKAAGLSPDERREIGVLKAVGWETGDVLLLKSYEAAVVSAAAFLAGTGLAVALLRLPGMFAAATALLGWSSLYPAFRPAPSLGAYTVATLFCLTVFPYLAATVVPSWRAATTDPDLVMRR